MSSLCKREDGYCALLAETLGLNPNIVILKEAVVKPHRTIIDNRQRILEEETILANAIKEALLKEIKQKQV